jgi:hypothetical protein
MKSCSSWRSSSPTRESAYAAALARVQAAKQAAAAAAQHGSRRRDGGGGRWGSVADVSDDASSTC